MYENESAFMNNEFTNWTHEPEKTHAPRRAYFPLIKGKIEAIFEQVVNFLLVKIQLNKIKKLPRTEAFKLTEKCIKTEANMN